MNTSNTQSTGAVSSGPIGYLRTLECGDDRHTLLSVKVASAARAAWVDDMLDCLPSLQNVDMVVVEHDNAHYDATSGKIVYNS